MNKQSFLPNKTTPVVQFSKLDQNNKAQFLQFLIRNNISFNNQTGKQNFTAKITLKNVDNNKNANINNNKNNKKNIKNDHKQQSKKVNRSPLKQINKLSNSITKKNATISPFTKKVLQQKDFSKTSITKISNNKQGQQNIRKNNKQNKIISRTPEKKRNNDQKQVSMKKQIYNTPRQTNSNIKKKQNNEQKYNHTPKIQKSNHKNYQNNSPINSRKQLKINNHNNQIVVINSHNQTVNNNNLNNNSNNNNINRNNILNNKNQNKVNNKKPKISDKIDKQGCEQKQRLNQRSDRYNKNNKNKNIRLQQDLDINNKQLNYELTHKFIHSQSQDRITLLNKYSNYFNLPTQYCASNPSRQRPICWSLKQLQRFLDEFYDDSFSKNTQQILIGSKKLNQSLHKQSRRYCYIAQTLIKYLNRKFNKVQKVIQYNLVNFIYSIAYYIYQSKPISINQDNSTMIALKIFQSFLMMKYQFQDYLFFLFTRNILKNDFKKIFITTLNQVNKNQIKQKQINLLDKSYTINKKQITRFLKHVIGQGNQQILEEYHQMIFDKIKQESQSSQIFIQNNKFVKIILDDYQIKRWAAQQSQRKKQQINKINKNHQYIHNEDSKQDSQNQFISLEHQQQGSSLQSTFSKILSLGYPKDNKLSKNYSNNIFGSNTNIIAQQSMQQLTFGQETKQFLKLNQQQEENQLICLQNMNFWSSSYKNQQQKQQIIQIQNQKINNNQLYGIIVQKLQKKTKQLIQILTATNNNNNNNKNFNKKNNNKQIQPYNIKLTDTYSQQLISNQLRADHLHKIQQLLLCKTINLFFTVIQMNKVKWLKQLQISTPSQQDIQKVQQLQLMFRKIRQLPTAKDIAQFCKNLLTVKQITNQLSKFFI